MSNGHSVFSHMAIYKKGLIALVIVSLCIQMFPSNGLSPVQAQSASNTAPTITLTSPIASGESSNSTYTVSWTDSDPDNNASISLYLDTNNSGNDGVLLVNNLKEDDNGGSGSYSLNVSSLIAGSYYIYAIIEDHLNTPAISYSPGLLTISDNRPTGILAGSTAGDFDVNFLGAGTYSVPISVSPGSAGMEPKLSISYNSQSGNGFMGMGWTLSGLSSISRCPATLAEDSLSDGVDFDNLDKFCLDGERLIVVSGTYGANGAKYRLEHEQFSDIISQGTRGTGPDQFTVRTKAGLTLHFQSLVAVGRSDALSWVVDKISDTSGNYITIAYTSDTTNGEYYPNIINYTGNSNTGLSPYNSVQFSYESRPDVITQYVAGSKIQISKRLSSIRTYNQTQLVREYRLAYQNGTVTNRSHLTSLTECGSDNLCFQPTAFGWSALSSNWGQLLTQKDSFWAPGSATWTGHGGSNYFHGDFNGDRKEDLMAGTPTAGIWHVLTSTGTNLVSVGGSANDGKWSGGINYQNNVVGDFNGDQKDDIAGFVDGTTNTWKISLSSGSNFNGANSGNWLNGPGLNANTTSSQVSKNFLSGDFDGNGKDDLIKYADPNNPANHPGDWRIVFSNGTGFLAGQTWAAPGTNGTSNIFVGDFNGDQKDDLITYVSSGQWQVYLSSGTGFTKLGSTWLGHSGGPANNIVADFNGDSKDDIAGYTSDAQQDWHVCLSTGNSFSCSMWLSATPNNLSAAAGDFNGDGKADIAIQKAVGSTEWIVGIAGKIQVGDFSGPDSGFFGGHLGGFERNVTGDFNGDGKMDLAGYTGDGSNWHVTLSTGKSFSGTPAFWAGANVAPLGDLSNVRSGDFNGDGRTDIATANGGKWNLALSNGANFTNYLTTGPVAGPRGTMQNILTGDFNGDGRTDVAGYDGVSKDWSIYFANNAGTGLVDGGWWRNGPTADPLITLTGDFNGDGKTDLAAYTGVGSQWHIALSTGTDFNEQESDHFWTGPTEGFTNTIEGDFNGDGKTDLAAYTTTPGIWHVFLSTGKDFISIGGTNNNGLWPGHAGGAQNNIVGDFNGDGLTDIAGFSIERQEWHVTLSTGTNFSGVGTGFWKGELAGASKTIVADFNGDGKSDLAGFSTVQKSWHVTAPGGFSPDLMSTITTGTGKTINVYYNPLTNTSVHVKDNDAVYPRFDFSGSLYVVSKYTESNGIGGANQYSYIYTGAETNLRGRGFRGFRVIQATDLQTGISTFTSFDQTHLYSGMPQKVVKQLSSGVLISVATNTFNYKDFGNGTYFSFIDDSKEEMFEINDSCKQNTPTTYSCSPVKTVITDYIYNPTDITFGNVSQVVNRTTGSFLTTVTNTYTNDTTKWILARLIQSQINQSAPNTPAIIRTSSFQYDVNTGLLTKETSDVGSSLELSKTYTRDSFGNITQSAVSAANLVTRNTSTTYDSQGRFVTKVTNALGQTKTVAYDSLLGNIISDTSPNQLTIQLTYDGFGRKTKEVHPDGTQLQQFYLTCTSACPSNAVYRVETRSVGTAPVITYFDSLDRVIRTETKNFNGQTILADTVLDNIGRTVQVSEPYVSGTSPIWHSYQYDAVNRQTKEIFPDSATQTSQYRGLTTIVTNQLGQTLSKTVNGNGWLIQSTDSLNNSMSYSYDAAGNTLKITDPAGNNTSMLYDLANNRIQITDPDTGTTKSTYNAYGELVTQVTAKNQTTSYTYDKLGRQLTRTIPEGTTTWTYDTAIKGIGNLAAVTQPWSKYSETYSYDALGRPSGISKVIDGTTYNTTFGYDIWGHQSSTTYPSGLIVRTQYHIFGSVAAVRNQVTRYLYWELHTVSSRGQVTEEKFGNQAISNKTYNPQTGYLTNIATKGETTTIQTLAFGFDPIGNLTSRSDTSLGLSEAFTYDALNRLIQSTLNGTGNLSLSYNSIGNILTKSDVGTYTYGGTNAGAHQVKSITGGAPNTYTYDTNGNRLTSATGNITYTSFNKPLKITEATASNTLTYDPNYNRIKQIATKGTQTITTLYLGSLERRITQNGTTSSTEDLHYISGPNGPVVAISIKTQNSTSTTTKRFLMLDHLGSIDAITDDYGNVVQKLSYDAWGRRRNPQNWKALPVGATASLNRGFTGHEELDDLNLINMNGRIYDPVIGRFVSADPFIQQADFIQSYNRYSYVLNNPLSFTDPSGYFLSGLFHAFKNFLQGVRSTFTNPKALLAIGIGVITSGAGLWAFSVSGMSAALGASASIGAAVVSGAGFGFGSAFSGSLLSGGSIKDALRAGLSASAIGAASSLAFQQVGSIEFIKENKILLSVSHGVIAGTASELQGHGFQVGFQNSIFQDVMSSVYAFTKEKIDDLARRTGNARKDPRTGEYRTDGGLQSQGGCGGCSLLGIFGMDPQLKTDGHWYKDLPVVTDFIVAVSKAHDFMNSWRYDWKTGNYKSGGVLFDTAFDVYSFSGMLPAAAFTAVAQMPKTIFYLSSAQEGW